MQALLVLRAILALLVLASLLIAIYELCSVSLTEEELEAMKTKQSRGSISLLDDSERALYERFEDLFSDVPIRNGQKWKSASVDELVTLFKNVAVICVKAHSGRVTVKDMLDDMANRCEDLASWMQANQYRRFYMESDMSHLIGKPRAVAERIKT